MSSGSDLIFRSIHGDIYNWALTSVYRGDRRVYDPSYALSRDPNIYAMMRRDPNIELALTKRATMVAGREWTVEPASEDKADVRKAALQAGLLRLARRMDSARRRSALAFFYGRTYEQMRGTFRTMRLAGDNAARRWWTIDQFKHVDHRRFKQEHRTDHQTGESWVEWWMWHVQDGTWVRLEDHRFFLKHDYEDLEEALGFSRGLVEALYWAFFAKGIAQREGLQGLERWAQGWVTAKVDLEREASTGKTTDQIIANWIATLKAQRTEHILVYGQNDEVEVIEPTGAGHQIVTDFLTYLDSQCTRLILGAVLPTGGGDQAAGSFARSRTEADSTEEIIQFDQQANDEAWSSDVLGLLTYMNAPVFRSMGLGEARDGVFRSSRQKAEDPTKNADVLAKATRDIRLPVLRKEAYAKLGLTMPKQGEDVIEPPPQPQPGASPFGAPPGEGGEPEQGATFRRSTGARSATRWRDALALRMGRVQAPAQR